MITKNQSYWHLYFNEVCEDTPAATLLKVEELFKEIAQMGDMAYLRVRPEIEHEKLFEGGTRAIVRCRITTPPPQAEDPDVFVAFGLRRSEE